MYVLWFYFNSSTFKILLMCTSICTSLSMYLFHILVHLGFRQVLEELSWLFSTMKPLFALKFSSYKWLWIKYSHLRIGISSPNPLLFVLSLAYSHNVLFRLFLGFMEINPYWRWNQHFFARIIFLWRNIYRSGIEASSKLSQPAHNVYRSVFTYISASWWSVCELFISCQPLNRPSKARDNENKTLSSYLDGCGL